MQDVVRLALIDEDPDDFTLIQGLLGEFPDRNYLLEWFPGAKEGREALRAGGFDVYLLDDRLESGHGLELLDEEQRCSPPKSIILLTGVGGPELDVTAMDKGASEVLPKQSLAASRLDRSIRSCVKRAHELERIREAEKLRIEKAAADEANRAKSIFLSCMSHEMRTPLSSIIGYTDLALDTLRADPEAMRYLRAIKSNGDYLLNLVNDLLDLSKIESGHLQLQIESFDWREAVARVIQTLEVRAKMKSIEIESSWGPDLPPLLVSDARRVQQILLNLIGNAVKFTDRGAVGVSVRLSVIDGERKLVIDVSDTGIGISPAEAERLFRPFQQADALSSRRYGGTGLGLDLSRKLANALGGDVRLYASAPGAGSIFRILLPARFVGAGADAATGRRAAGITALPHFPAGEPRDHGRPFGFKD